MPDSILAVLISGQERQQAILYCRLDESGLLLIGAGETAGPCKGFGPLNSNLHVRAPLLWLKD